MCDKKRKISIIMGIYNCEKTLDTAIESILNQTYSNWEMIMCDDGSSDNTYNVALKYQEKYPDKFILIRNEKNMGLNITLNNCLKYAKGEYVARMDGDDVSLPNRFEKQLEFLESNPQYAIVSSPMILFDESGDWGKTKVIEQPQIIDFVYHSPFFCHAACMIRRKAFMDVGGYTEDNKFLRYEDVNLWYKMYGKGYRGYNFTEPLYKMRDDRDAASRRDFSSRMRAVYVTYAGFKLVDMPKKYYITLILNFVRNFLLALCPSSVYIKLHKQKNNFGVKSDDT